MPRKVDDPQNGLVDSQKKVQKDPVLHALYYYPLLRPMRTVLVVVAGVAAPVELPLGPAFVASFGGRLLIPGVRIPRKSYSDPICTIKNIFC